jgi:hypothetical protein
MHQDSNNLYVSHLYILGALQKSLSNYRGMCFALKTCDGSIAAMMLRSQIDVAARIKALEYFADQEAACQKILAGTPIRDLKPDLKAGKLFDVTLIERLSIDHNWIMEVYKNCNKHVHFCETHFINSVSNLNEPDRILTIELAFDSGPKKHENLTKECAEAFINMIEITEEVIDAWLANPLTPKPPPSQTAAHPPAPDPKSAAPG